MESCVNWQCFSKVFLFPHCNISHWVNQRSQASNAGFSLPLMCKDCSRFSETWWYLWLWKFINSMKLQLVQHHSTELLNYFPTIFQQNCHHFCLWTTEPFTGTSFMTSRTITCKKLTYLPLESSRFFQYFTTYQCILVPVPTFLNVLEASNTFFFVYFTIFSNVDLFQY